MKLILFGLIFACSVLCQNDVPFACNLKVFQPEERRQHVKLTHDVMSALVAHRDLPHGYSFQIDPARVSLIELAEWVAQERRCCPFFNFQIVLDGPAEGQLTLSLTGREGVKQFIRAEFREVLPADF